MGEMCGAGDLQLQKLEEFAKDQDNIQIDMSKLRRMDFVCTGTFLNLLTGLRRNHKTVSIFGANQMLIALLGVMGIDSLVTMVKDKER